MDDDPGSMEGFCHREHDRIEHLFAALDLDAEGLDAARRAWSMGDRVAACTALLDAHVARAAQTSYAMAPVCEGQDTEAAAEEILADRYTFQNVTGTPPREGGVLDWTHTGPNHDNEWAFFLNRHGHLSELLAAYSRTGNRRYVRRIDADLQEWVLHNEYPGEQTRDPRWRGLETMARIGVWARIFYGLAHDPLLSPAARLLILCSIPDHAHYTRHYHAGGGNWLAMQMTALATAGFAWPAFRDAEAWIDYAQRTLEPQLSRQVYPDGAQKELTSHYHGATLTPLQRFADLFEAHDRALPAAWRDCLERMWSYWADTIRPDGHGVLNNDSNLDFNRPRLLAIWERYGRGDWAWAASNGEVGERPPDPPSRLLPWAGQLVSRSSWSADAHWSFFDIGPWGIGHQHQDKLHLSVAAFGTDFLVDAGRLYYKRDAWRDFICGTRAHNTLIIDGCEQCPDEKEATSPLPDQDWAIADTFDFARASFTAGYETLQGEAAHTRAVLYLRGRCWIVVDRVTTDQPRRVETLWHFHPACQVDVAGATATATRDGGQLRVMPVGDDGWETRLITGQTEPEMQGWYSREYNHRTAAPCMSAKRSIDASDVVVWLISPSAEERQPISATLMQKDLESVTVAVEGPTQPLELTIPLDGGRPVFAR